MNDDENARADVEGAQKEPLMPGKNRRPVLTPRIIS